MKVSLAFMVVSQQQLRAFQAGMLDRFAEIVCEHVSRYFESDCKRIGPDRLRKLVRDGITRAQGWGFIREREIVEFVDLLFVLSPTFDLDPRLPWAEAILQSDVEAAVRLERLWIGATRLLQQLDKCDLDYVQDKQWGGIVKGPLVRLDKAVNRKLGNQMREGDNADIDVARRGADGTPAFDLECRNQKANGRT